MNGKEQHGAGHYLAFDKDHGSLRSDERLEFAAGEDGGMNLAVMIEDEDRNIRVALDVPLSAENVAQLRKWMDRSFGDSESSALCVKCGQTEDDRKHRQVPDSGCHYFDPKP